MNSLLMTARGRNQLPEHFQTNGSTLPGKGIRHILPIFSAAFHPRFTDFRRWKPLNSLRFTLSPRCHRTHISAMWRPNAIITTIFAAWTCGCSDNRQPQWEPATASTTEVTIVEQPTFNRDVAPIVFTHCSGCHRPGESAPFSLLGFHDVHKRAKQILDVTHDGYMPPWLPEAQPEEARFSDARRLQPHELQILQRWVDQGMPEGDASDLPPLPKWTPGWQLGEPDLVIEWNGAYTLPADGPDVFRSFVLPVPIKIPRYIRSVEIRPENPRIVHHGVLLIDRGQSGRLLDAADPDPGYPGMEQSSSITSPGGHFFGWTPGKIPKHGEPDMAWKLEPGNDLVIALHLLPSGKPEPLGVKIGLFFTDESPTRFPVMIELENKTLDIPPGQADYRIEDKFTLPVDTLILGIYPHAHYLGSSMLVTATAPGGTPVNLLHIKEWDFNWQDDYRYDTPLEFPKNTEIRMEFHYDNSAANPRNPNDPPRRVVFGERSSDEMGSLWIQTLPKRVEELGPLHMAAATKRDQNEMEGFKFALDLNPDDPEAHSNLGAALALSQQMEAAEAHFKSALDSNPDYAPAHFNYGLWHLQTNQMVKAREHFRKVISLQPDHADAHGFLGSIAEQAGDYLGARTHYLNALKARPSANTHYNLGVISLRTDEIDQAIKHFLQTVNAEPDNLLAIMNLGACYFNKSDWPQAETYFRKALTIDSRFVPALINLGNVLMQQDSPRAAISQFQKAVDLDPNNRQAWEALQSALQQQNR